MGIKRDNQIKRLNAVLNRPCKGCGIPIGTADKRQLFCSRECGYENRRLDKIKIDCCVCGKRVDRYAKHVDKHKVACCSSRCQLAYATQAGVKKRGVASRRAKERWNREETLRRQKSSQGYAWWKIAKRKHKLLNRVPVVVDDWFVKCTTAAMTLSDRVAFSPSQSTAGGAICDKQNWNSVIQTALNQATAKYMIHTQTQWQRKCTSTARSIKLRSINSTHEIERT